MKLVLLLAGPVLVLGCHAEFHASAGSPPQEEAAAPAQGGEAQPEVAAVPAESAAPEAAAEPAKAPSVARINRRPQEPAEEPAPEQPAEDPPATPATGTLEVVCQFSDGWIAVVPRRIYRPNDEYLMQALIGFGQDPNFWGGQPSWQRYRAHAARQCGVDPLRLDLAPGSWVVLVGWAGQFNEETMEYSNNGRIERVTVRAGETIQKNYLTDMLTHDWHCISCPFLCVRQAGRVVELGQVLVDRYSVRREGTDVRRARVDVEAGRIAVTLVEREPEVSRVDAVQVLVGGRALRLADGMPAALEAVDDVRHSFRLGESVEVVFDAGGLPDGAVDAEIRVTGHYEPIGPL